MGPVLGVAYISTWGVFAVAGLLSELASEAFGEVSDFASGVPCVSLDVAGLFALSLPVVLGAGAVVAVGAQADGLGVTGVRVSPAGAVEGCGGFICICGAF